MDDAAMRPEGRPVRATHRGNGRQARPRVLVIEDDAAVRALLGAQLAGEYEFHEEMSGEGGLTLARAVHPDVVLLDLTLPGAMHGFDVLDAFLADHELTAVPVIVVTGSSDSATLTETLARGAHDFLGKPWQAT